MIVARTTDLTRRFGPKTAVDRLDLEVNRGEVLALLGHNGAGKTTVVRLLNGVLTPTLGEVRVFGLDPLTQGTEVRRRTGVLTESQSLEERLDARQNLRYYAALYAYPPEKTEARVDDMLETLGLADATDRPVGGFSKGMKQRLALARALFHDPEMLFLDEPTAGLDPVAARQVVGLIKSQSREAGRTVLLCTHNLAEAQQVADRVAVLRAGKLVAVGTPHELVAGLGARARLRLLVAAAHRAAAKNVVGQLVYTEEDDGALLLEGTGREAVPDLVRALVAAGVDVYALEPSEPTLEDVYFSLYGSGPSGGEAATGGSGTDEVPAREAGAREAGIAP